MSLFWRLVPWLSRFVLLAATFVFAMIGRKFILDPAGSAADSGLLLGSALAVTDMRASFGAFPLGCALVALACLISERRRLTGLYFVATIVGTVLAVRIFGVIVDHTLSESVPLITAELVLLSLAAAGIAGELTKRHLEVGGAAPVAAKN
jgi:hypothetical protein